MQSGLDVVTFSTAIYLTEEQDQMINYATRFDFSDDLNVKTDDDLVWWFTQQEADGRYATQWFLYNVEDGLEIRYFFDEELPNITQSKPPNHSRFGTMIGKASYDFESKQY